MGVISTDINDLMALHAQKTHPNIGLDMLEHMAKMNWAIGIWQGTGDKNLALHEGPS